MVEFLIISAFMILGIAPAIQTIVKAIVEDE